MDYDNTDGNANLNIDVDDNDNDDAVSAREQKFLQAFKLEVVEVDGNTSQVKSHWKKHEPFTVFAYLSNPKTLHDQMKTKMYIL